MNILDEYTSKEIDLVRTGAQALSSFLEENFKKNVYPSDQKLKTLYAEFSVLLNNLRGRAYELLGEKKLYTDISQQDIEAVLKEFFTKEELPETKTHSVVLFTNPHTDTFFSSIQNFLRDFPQNKNEMIEQISKSFEKIEEKDKETSKKMVSLLLDNKIKPFRDVLSLLPQDCLKHLPGNGQPENPNQVVDQSPLKEFVCSKDEYSKVPNIINNEKLNELLIHWEGISKAYENLDGKKESTHAFLSSLYEFSLKVTGLFGSSNDDKIQAFTNLGLLLFAKGKLLKPDLTKQKILENILLQANLLHDVNFEINRKQPNRTSLVNQFVNQVAIAILPQMKDQNLTKSNFLSDLIKKFTTTLAYTNLALIYSNGLNQDISTKPEMLLGDIKQYNPLMTFVSQFKTLGKESPKDRIESSYLGIVSQMQLAEAGEEAQTLLSKKSSLPSQKALFELDQLKFKIHSEDVENGFLEDQAAVKYRAIKAKYKITKEEADLIKKITGIEFEYLIPRINTNYYYPKGTLSYGELYDKINKKITIYENDNLHWSRKGIFALFRRRPVETLKGVLTYLKYHSEKYNANTQLTPLEQNDHKERTYPSQAKDKKTGKLLYEISDDNKNYIQRETGIPFTNLIPFRIDGEQYPDGTLDYEQLYKKISERIVKCKIENNHWTRRLMISPRHNVKELQRLLDYVEIRIPTNKLSSKQYRNDFNNIVKKLSPFSKINKDLKQLQTIMSKKLSASNKSKMGLTKVDGSTPENKNERNQKTLDRLRQGSFFTPTLLQLLYHSLFSKQFDPESKLLLEQYHTALALPDELDRKIKIAQRIFKEVSEKSPNEAKKRSCAVNYDDEVLKVKSDCDTQSLPNIIQEDLKKLTEVTDKSTLDEIQHFVNNMGLLKALAEKWKNGLLNEIGNLPIDQLITIKKITQISNYEELLKSTNIDFKPDEKFALKKVSAMVQQLGANKKSFKNSSASYLATLKMQISAKQKVRDILQDPDKITQEIENYTNSLEQFEPFHVKHEINSPSIIEKAYLLQIIADLKFFKELLSSEEDYNEEYAKYIGTIETLESDYKKECALTDKIVAGARSTLDAVKYLAYHTTSHVRGNQN